jgi:hypothetical protein
MGFCDVGWHKFSLSPSSQPKICRAITELGFLLFYLMQRELSFGPERCKGESQNNVVWAGKKERKRERELIKGFFLISKKNVVINPDFETSLKFVLFKLELIHSIKFD